MAGRVERCDQESKVSSAVLSTYRRKTSRWFNTCRHRTVGAPSLDETGNEFCWERAIDFHGSLNLELHDLAIEHELAVAADTFCHSATRVVCAAWQKVRNEFPELVRTLLNTNGWRGLWQKGIPTYPVQQEEWKKSEEFFARWISKTS